MSYLSTLLAWLGVGFITVGLILLILHILKHRSLKTPGIDVLVGVVLFAIGLAVAPAPPTKQEQAAASRSSRAAAQSSQAASSREASVASHAAAESRAKVQRAKTVLAKLNAAIAKTLKQDQGFAAGTLDHNGHSTKTGTANPAFAWALMVISVKIDQDHHVKAQVNAQVAPLTDRAKKQLGTHCANLALATLAELGQAKDAELNEGLFTEVYFGHQIVAQSHLTDNKAFRAYSW
ncbi:hypothetical protein [Lacticaseibacillus suihuaensis]